MEDVIGSTESTNGIVVRTGNPTMKLIWEYKRNTLSVGPQNSSPIKYQWSSSSLYKLLDNN